MNQAEAVKELSKMRNALRKMRDGGTLRVADVNRGIEALTFAIEVLVAVEALAEKEPEVKA
jgi:hypothetical protein